MKLNTMWTFINDNSNALNVILSAFLIIGPAIVFCFNYKKNKKLSNSKIIKEQQITIKNLENEINSLNSELDKYRLVEKATDGDFFIQIETNTPICPVCWSSNKQATPIYTDNDGYFTCSICKHHGKYSYSDIADYKRASEEYLEKIISESSQAKNNYNKYF